jgi:HK97 family phage prohead protease
MSRTLTTQYAGVLLELSASEADGLDERGIPKQLGRQYRRVQVAADAYNADKHTVVLAVSSETPVARYFGNEVLSHEKGALRTDRLKNGIALLFNHDYDAHLGRSQSWKLRDDGVLEITNRFGSNPLALEKEGDVASGILVDVSIGYVVHEWDVKEDKNGVRTYTAVDWEILENSMVTVPADPTVGAGRDAGPVKVRSFTSERELPPVPDPDPAAARAASSKAAGDEDDEDDDDGDDDDTRSAAAIVVEPTLSATTANSEQQRTTTMAAATVDLTAENQKRVASLQALRANPQYARVYSGDDLAGDLASPTTTVDQVKARIADKLVAESEGSNVRTIADSVFGRMSEKEKTRYSIRNVYAAAVNQRFPRTFSDKGAEAGFEREVGQDLQKEGGERGLEGFGGGIVMPSPTSRFFFEQQTRTITSGGNFGTNTNVTYVESDVIELLRYKLSLLAMGARFMTGLHGIIKMPRQSGAASSNWLAESATATESDTTFDAITLAPSRLSMYNAATRDQLAQSAVAIDPLMAADRLAVLNRSLETACLAGSGTAPVPLGLMNQTGIPTILAGTTRAANGTVTAGAGGVPLTYVDYNNMEATISTANGDIGTLGWITTPKVRAGGRSTPKIPGTASDMIWPDSKPGANGNWGLSEVIVDPYTQASAAIYNIIEHAYYGTAVRHLASFCVCTSALPS